MQKVDSYSLRGYMMHTKEYLRANYQVDCDKENCNICQNHK